MNNVKILILLTSSLHLIFINSTDLGKTEECAYISMYRYLKNEIQSFNDSSLDLNNNQYLKERIHLKKLVSGNKDSGQISHDEYDKLIKRLGE